VEIKNSSEYWMPQKGWLKKNGSRIFYLSNFYMAQIELIPFIPENASYQIWHSEDFLVHEDQSGIVTLTSSKTNSNLTLTSYSANQQVNEKLLLDFFQDATKKYVPLAEMKSISTDNRIWLEREFQKDNIFWIWWVVGFSNQIVLASINSEKILSQEDRHLYLFMIDKMEIYPAEAED
jgi:hypothetical protein